MGQFPYAMQRRQALSAPLLLPAGSELRRHALHAPVVCLGRAKVLLRLPLRVVLRRALASLHESDARLPPLSYLAPLAPKNTSAGARGLPVRSCRQAGRATLTY